ncbi:hypothetical protein QUF50_10605 [Thiotrichales bacterium HSG1]|nr:hypothetical protein [Thiotrichales bacterium HSG1]
MILICLAFLLSVGLTLYFSRTKTLLCILDKPNERSLHDKPTPVTGGLAILLSIIITLFLVDLLYFSIQDYLWLFASCLLIAIISFLDDCRQIFIPYRLLIHCIAAVLLLWNYDLTILFDSEIPKSFQIIFSFLFIVWMTNLYNFMEG